MKFEKATLDEMQDKHLLIIEETGFWLAFCGLGVAVILQLILGSGLRAVAGELFVLFLQSIYLVYHCMKSGIWSRSIAPTRKNNALFSCFPSAFIGVLAAVKAFILSHNPVSAEFIFQIVATMAITYLLCYLILEAMRTGYNKRRSKLDSSEDDE